MDRNSQIEYLRELAAKVREIADGKKNQAAIKRWHDLHDFKKPDRPPVWIRPVTAWRELLPNESLMCGDTDLCEIEINLRQQLIKNEIGDDTPFYPWYEVHAVFDAEPENIYGYTPKVCGAVQEAGAWGYGTAFEYSDFDILKTPKYTFNKKKTDDNLEFINFAIGKYLPAKLVCSGSSTWPDATLGTVAADFRGLMGLMMDTMDYPDELHRLMAYFRDCFLTAADAYEKSEILTPNVYGPMICSNEFGEKTDGKYTLKNCYCLANSQEFDQISPPMWEEFLLNYQKPLFERFGRVVYGCCENLTNKIDGVLSIPNLHMFVCSAWSDLSKVAAKVGDKHIIMWRQKASDVFFEEDLKVLRRGISEGLKTLAGCRPEIVLREIETLGPFANRIYDYTQMVIEEASGL